MGRIVDTIRALAFALGAPGLFLVAFLDSSFLSLPEIVDLLVIWMVTGHKSRLVVYVASATLGSISGCLVVYYLGRKGGEALARRHFTTAGIERAIAAFQRHGVMAVFIPSMLPPPLPFKIFVLLAGVAGIDAARFTTAIAIGRGMRYLVLGVLAVEYGDRAMTYVREHGTLVSLVLVGVLALGAIASLRWYNARASKRR